MEMVRKNYRACLKQGAEVKEALAADCGAVRAAIGAGRCMTVALYRHRDMLFLYLEQMDAAVTPELLFPATSELLVPWPEKDGLHAWAYMYPVYCHAMPEDLDEWARKEKKIRRGRIAYLLEDKLLSYLYYHKAIVDEGLLEGDRYQFISLHENILFSYFEEPKIFTHLKKESREESAVIREWMAADPESHFDHSLSGEENFLLIEELFSMGVEDLEC